MVQFGILVVSLIIAVIVTVSETKRLKNTPSNHLIAFNFYMLDKFKKPPFLLIIIVPIFLFCFVVGYAIGLALFDIQNPGYFKGIIFGGEGVFFE